jgi:branched-subunit amino acid aminotransferase/4-amino-4-deoxychorismate lyase
MPLANAAVSLHDRGLHFGCAVFETLLVHNGQAIAWDLHRSRLCDALEHFGWAKGHDSILNHEAVMLAKACRQAAAGPWVVKVLVTEGSNPSFEAQSEDLKPCRYWTATPNSSNYLMRPSVASLSLAAVSLRPVLDARAMMLRSMKTTAYLASRMVLLDARRMGFDDAAFVTGSGEILESTSASLLWLDADDGLLATPGPEAGCLPSVSIARLRQALAQGGGCVVSRELSVHNLERARAVVVVSSVRGARAVRAIGGHAFDTQSSAELAHRINELLCAQAGFGQSSAKVNP